MTPQEASDLGAALGRFIGGSNRIVLTTAREMVAAIADVHAAFGAPGDFGYGTKQGDALFALYNLRPHLLNLIEGAEKVEAEIAAVRR